MAQFKSAVDRRTKAEKIEDVLVQASRMPYATSWEDIGKAAGVPGNTIRQWRNKDPDFRDRCDHVKAGLKAGEQEGSELPDFLRWRELCCAYIDNRTNTVKRAQNNWYQQDAFNQLESHNRLIVVLPPGHIKTTFFCIEYPTWRLMKNRNDRITIVQKNADEAAKLVMAVQERLTDNDYYAYLSGRLKEQGEQPIVDPLTAWFLKEPFKPQSRQSGEKWGAYGFKVLGRTSGEKDDSLAAKGVGGQIQGIRADLIILDDIQDPELARKSVQDSEDKMSWFHNVILGRVYDYQKVVVLANRFGPEDFASKLMEQHPDWPVVFYPAIIEDPETGEPAPLCPEVWTLEGLERKKKEVGETTWYYTWMQEAGNFEDATFRREALEAARDDQLRLGDVPFAVTDIFMGVDPAVSANGYCAIVVWGLDRRTKQRYLIDVFNKSGMRHFANIEAQIVEYARAYSSAGRTCVIEHANVQESLILSPTLVRELRNLGWRIEGYKTASGTGARAEQSNFDITTIGGLFDAGLVTIPYGGTYKDRELVNAYIDQLVKWRTDDHGRSIKNLTRDMVMATLFAESAAFQVAQRERKSEGMVYDRSRVPDWVWAEHRAAFRV